MKERMGDEQASAVATSESRYLYQVDSLPTSSDAEDLRWKTLVDSGGEKIGTIESIDTDEETCRVEFVEVGRGGFLGFGAERFLVPVIRIIGVDEKTVQIDSPSTVLEGVPPYDPDRLGDPDYRSTVRSWWLQANR